MRGLEALRTNLDVIQCLGYQPIDVSNLAYIAQNERGFFWFLAMSCRRYLCGDPKLRRKIDRKVQAA
jgi:hypothetical protein